MFGNAGYTIDEVIESVDKNLWGLTCFAEFRSEDKELAPMPRKRYPNIKSIFNAMDASIGKLEELSKKIPKDRRMRTGFLAVETGMVYSGTEFLKYR
mmetsp:Transcript_6341/g.27021  ORF Transcript_6341/g.27021 Transcript_6341/m.27021 type:complete len:97 (-) Transcript_6341:1520-1810(-)